jgi:hypothetical protein
VNYCGLSNPAGAACALGEWIQYRWLGSHALSYSLQDWLIWNQHRLLDRLSKLTPMLSWSFNS